MFAGKTYVKSKKEDALAYMQDWHTQLMRDYQPYISAGYGKDPAASGISFTRQQRTGRAFFIYTSHYWPELQKKADTAPPEGLFKEADDAAAKKDGESEATSATRINPQSYRTLFPETFAKDYDAEAKKQRQEAIAQFDEHEKWKLYAAQHKDKSEFILFGGAQYWPGYTAELHEQEAARIRNGQWDSLLFKDHRLFFSLDALDKAEKVAGAEYDKYVNAADNPDPLWKEALEKKAQWQGELDKQNNSDADTSGAEKDLAAATVAVSILRNKVGKDVMPPEVISAWNDADQAMIGLRPAAVKGDVATDVRDNAVKLVGQFYGRFRVAVTGLDTTTTVNKYQGGSVPEAVEQTDNPYFSPAIQDGALTMLRYAHDKNSWKYAFEYYNNAVIAMDNYIAAQLEAKGRKDEGEQLKLAAGRAHELTNLLEEHKDAQKVQAMFYPLDDLENRGTPGVPDFAAKGIPLLFYIYRDDSDWNLVDVTTPQNVKVTSAGGGDDSKPDMDIFSKVNSKLRFPKGQIYFRLPDGTNWHLETTEPWRLSEWLTYIGIFIGLVGLAILTLGASIPAELLLVGAAVGVAAGTADLVEKKRAGVLTTRDIAVDGVQIAASILTGGSAKLGQVVLSEAAQAGISAAEVGGLAGRLLVPVTLAAVGADVTSFALVTSDSIKMLADIDKQSGTDEDKKVAKLKTIAMLIGSGVITFLGVRSSLKTLGMTGRLRLDLGGGGELTARAMLSDEELLKAAKGVGNAEHMGKVLNNEALPQEVRHSLRAGLSEALTGGPIAPRKLNEMLGRLAAATKAEEVNAILAEMNARSRIGAICDGEVAARVSTEDAKTLARLDDATFDGLRGSSPRELASFASVVAQDAKEGARLIGRYRQQIADYLRTNPTPDLATLEDIVAKMQARVVGRVEGLFEGIDTTKPPQGWKFKDSPVTVEPDGTKVIKTDVTGPNGATGTFETAYNPTTKKLELRNAFMRAKGAKADLPGSVPKQDGGAELRAGKGTPTAQYVTLYQMKILGVPIGEGGAAGLQRIHLDDIQNAETVIHLHWLRQKYPSSDMRELLESTAIVKYADSNLQQAGYQRRGMLSVSGGENTRIGKLLAFYENGRPRLIEEHRLLLEKYGFNRDTVMFYGFGVDVPVVPKAP